MPSVDIEKFTQAVASLKLAHRAELKDDETNDPLIQELYVDLGKSNEVLNLLKSAESSSLLIGRRGTGKSTLFQRMQSDLRSSGRAVCVYLDVKSLSQQAKMVEPALRRLSEKDATINVQSAQRNLTAEAFVTSIAEELVKELSIKAGGFLFKLTEAVFGSREQAVQQIKELLSVERYSLSKNIAAIERVTKTVERIEEEKDDAVVAAMVRASSAPLLGGIAGRLVGDSMKEGNREETVETHVSIFDYNAFSRDLATVLGTAHVRDLYLFIDDFSELEPEMMSLLVDNIVRPLSNSDFKNIKIKIAVYPNRYRLDDMDLTKWDRIPLDAYDRFGASNNIAMMEQLATDFLKRLLTKRVKHFCGCEPDAFFEGQDHDEIWAALYRATFGVPRMVGFVLHNIISDCLLRDEKITVRAVNEAAKKAYEERVEIFFRSTHLASLPLADVDKAPASHQALLDTILTHAHTIRTDKDPNRSASLKNIDKPPTSHFMVDERLEPVLAALEMNSFLTRYGIRKDKDKRNVVLYALNYGLCLKSGIVFLDTRIPAHNKLLEERRFNYTTVIDSYLRRSSNIRCQYGHVEQMDKLETLKEIGMHCPQCLKEGRGAVSIKFVPVADTFPAQIASGISARVSDTASLQICDVLHREARAMTAAEIGEEIDLSGKDVGPFARNLLDLGLLKHGAGKRGKKTYALSEEAKGIYFASGN